MSGMHRPDGPRHNGSAAIPLHSVNGATTNYNNSSLPRSASERVARHAPPGKVERRHLISTFPTFPMGSMMVSSGFAALPASYKNDSLLNQRSLAHRRRFSETKSETKPASIAPPPPPAAIVDRPLPPLPGIPKSSSESELHDGDSFPAMHVRQPHISEEQARWFLSLPEKVRRQLFSHEEQIGLVVRCKGVLAAIDASKIEPQPSNARWAAGNPSTSMERPSTPRNPANTNVEGFLDVDDASVYSASVYSTDTGNIESEIFGLYTQQSPIKRLAFTPKELAPQPPSWPRRVQAEIAEDQPKQQSFSRKIALTPLPLPPPTLAPRLPPKPQSQPQESTSHVTTLTGLSRPHKQRRHSVSDSFQERKEYQDEDAKKQLRNTLYSPKKSYGGFDFGFSPGHNSTPSTLTTTDSVLSISTTTELFQLQETPPFPSGTEDEDSHSLDTQSPATPTNMSDTQHTAIKQASFDSGISFPLHQKVRPKTPSIRPKTPVVRPKTPAVRPKTPLVRSAGNSVGSRDGEMYTDLPRRALRPPEIELYMVQRDQTSGVEVDTENALALESLPFCDDPTGAHGAFAVHDDGSPKGIKRVWKTLKKH